MIAVPRDIMFPGNAALPQDPMLKFILAKVDGNEKLLFKQEGWCQYPD